MPNRYRVIEKDPYAVLLKDDGARIWAMIIEPDNNSEAGKWELWAEYKHCDLPMLAMLISDALMEKL
jgi:hypothetical protein